jgi:hypothetical protein
MTRRDPHRDPGPPVVARFRCRTCGRWLGSTNLGSSPADKLSKRGLVGSCERCTRTALVAEGEATR